MKIKELEINDVDEVVAIHQGAFKGFFLTELGKKFLGVYYASCIRDKKMTIAIGVYSLDNKLLGFSIGSVQSKGYYKTILKKNLFSFFKIGLYLVLTKPFAIIRLMKNMDKVKNQLDDGLYSELLSIGIEVNQKGKGYGKILLEEFEQEVIKRGGKKVSLTTDYENNDGVIAFYEKSGYKVFYEFITYPKRRMYKFIKEV